jgi:hypothetical protein
MIVPDGHDKNHSGAQGSAHLGETSLGSEFVGVAESSLLSSAEGVGDGVAGDSSDL